MTNCDLDLRVLTAEIVGSYLEHNRVAALELPSLIRNVYGALVRADGPTIPEAPAEHAKATPAQIRKSIRPEALISFIDGRPYKTLKRHIQSQGMTVEGYLERYGLPSDYPLVSERTSSLRSEFAKQFGLGRRTLEAEPTAEAPSPHVGPGHFPGQVEQTPNAEDQPSTPLLSPITN